MSPSAKSVAPTLRGPGTTIRQLEMALGIKVSVATNWPKCEGTPLPELQDSIWELGQKYCATSQHDLRYCERVRNDIRSVFNELGPRLWPDGSIDRSDWLYYANEESIAEYRKDLYFFKEDDRDKLDGLFRDMMTEKIISFQKNRIRDGKIVLGNRIPLKKHIHMASKQLKDVSRAASTLPQTTISAPRPSSSRTYDSTNRPAKRARYAMEDEPAAEPSSTNGDHRDPDQIAEVELGGSRHTGSAGTNGVTKTVSDLDEVLARTCLHVRLNSTAAPYTIELKNCYSIQKLFQLIDKQVKGLVQTYDYSLSVSLDDGRKVLLVRDSKAPFETLVRHVFWQTLRSRLLEAWMQQR